MKRPSILWIDDDKVLGELGSEYLEGKGFSVTVCLDGESGISKALNYEYDLILLDIMLPSINGLHILKVLQKCTKTPVIMLTASGAKKNELEGLESGAIDYINKPCDLDILIARIKRTLKVSAANTKSLKRDILTFDDLTLNPLTREVYLAEHLLKLTNSEFEILKQLMMFSGQSISKKQLLEDALGRAWKSDDKNLDTHIKNLRNKIKLHQHSCTFRIKTVYGFGYILEKNG